MTMLNINMTQHPFCSRADFEFAEIALDAALNKSHINGLLALIGRISRGETQMTLKTDTDLRKAWEHATDQVAPFTKHNITTHVLPLWEWALDLLGNLVLAPHFVWDAQRLYKHNGTEFERFYNEPWMGDRWWDVQSRLPPGLKAAPFCFILYADKTRLSSHGTVKAYPVVVRCANLPVGIQHGEGIGGGRIVGWLPIVSEEADEEGKMGFVSFKRVVWHESFLKLLELVVQYSKTGYAHQCFDMIIRWLFPILLILSADYEEQCMMSLIRGQNCKCPCPVCVVLLEKLHDLSKTFALRSMQDTIDALNTYKISKGRGEALLKVLGLCAVAVSYSLSYSLVSPLHNYNVFWRIAYSDPHEAISFDCLHSLHIGMWKHLLEELKKILKVAKFPRWRNFNHFSTVIHITFSDGNKMQDLSKQTLYSALNILTHRASPEGYQLLCVISSYLQLDSYIGLDVQTTSTLAALDAELLVFNTTLKDYVECVSTSPIEDLKLDWDFPKTHLWKHVTRDIRMKGATRNYSTRPNEKLHGPLKEAYERQSNGKEVADQVCFDVMIPDICCSRRDNCFHYNNRYCTSINANMPVKLLRMRVDTLDEQRSLPDDEAEADETKARSATFEGHVKLGSPQQPVSIQDIENSHGQRDHAFQGFRRKFSDFINTSLPGYGHHLERWLSIPANFQIQEHRYLKVNYKSSVDWRQTTNYLQCNPHFHGHPCYDCALMQLTQDTSVFVQLIFMFKCQLPDVGSFELALVQPFTAGVIGAPRRIDRDFRLTCIKAVSRASSIFVLLCSFIHGALLYPDPAHQDKFIVVDHIDSDMFIRMKTWAR
ncbi:uncharacterized protein F5891DRAFT_1128297 [Suillus fuscotomentosus]|uniref:Uncharacterized protein n=1 Tax=Suillus fuscotomentosus TaxID=1912939 RepID=A0AAD4E7J7_9AGAM|nr:uncharacterized protein F5891DRAFT_1128297 [Suillus fuscotomentosus]KAG1901040.1 hypothetical protein F5891DRAFT_1128297 [Suillus fuscotomentosus]